MRLSAILAALLLIAVFFLLPPLSEQTDGECSALEQRVTDIAAHDASGALIVGQLYGSSSSAPSGAAFARDHYPILPASLGCAIAYWRTAFGSPLPASPPAASASAGAGALPVEAAPPASMIARDITPNGDPISPETTFIVPMRSVAIRARYPAGTAGALRFQLREGRTVLSTCPAQKAGPGTAWCRFDVELRKGLYSISFTANNVLLGQYPFTVIGR